MDIILSFSQVRLTEADTPYGIYIDITDITDKTILGMYV